MCVAQAIMGIPSDQRFAAAAPEAPRASVSAVSAVDAEVWVAQAPRPSRRCNRGVDRRVRPPLPGLEDDLLLVDSTPVECARSRETVTRGGHSSLGGALADAADYGFCASHSRYFWGSRLHGLFVSDGTPRALALTSPKVGECEVCLAMLGRVERDGPVTVIGDKGYAGRDFEAAAADLDALILRPRRKDEPGKGPSPRSANGSSRSFRPAKTSSPSNATAPAPSTASEHPSAPASSPSPPRSPLNHQRAAPHAHSSPTPPNSVELLISSGGAALPELVVRPASA